MLPANAPQVFLSAQRYPSRHRVARRSASPRAPLLNQPSASHPFQQKTAAIPPEMFRGCGSIASHFPGSSIQHRPLEFGALSTLGSDVVGRPQELLT
jgi:hypothetical protein